MFDCIGMGIVAGAIVEQDVKARANKMAFEVLGAKGYAEYLAEQKAEEQRAQDRADAYQQNLNLCNAIKSTSFWRFGA